jgi:hypothetical protein
MPVADNRKSLAPKIVVQISGGRTRTPVASHCLKGMLPTDIHPRRKNMDRAR